MKHQKLPYPQTIDSRSTGCVGTASFRVSHLRYDGPIGLIFKSQTHDMLGPPAVAQPGGGTGGNYPPPPEMSGTEKNQQGTPCRFFSQNDEWTENC